MIWTLKQLTDRDVPMSFIDGEWVPARPENNKYRSLSCKIRESYLLFIGKTESFKWPKDQ